MPSRLAAVAPSTTAGTCVVASSRNRPRCSVACTRASRSGSAPDHARCRRSPLGDLVECAAPSPGRADHGRRLDRRDALDHRRRLLGQRRPRRRGTSGPGCDLEQVGAELVEPCQQVGAARRRDADDGHHRRDADRDAEGRQRRPGRGRVRGPSSAVASRCRAALMPSPPRVGHDRPSRSSIRRGSESAISRSWVMTSDRRADRVQVAEQVEDRRPTRSRGCRSARRRARSAGSPTIARAIATRWRSPPDSSPAGAGADARARPGRGATRPAAGARASRAPRYSSTASTLSTALSPSSEVELLEDEADRPRPQRRQLGDRTASPRLRRPPARCRRGPVEAARSRAATSTSPSRTDRRSPTSSPTSTVRSMSRSATTAPPYARVTPASSITAVTAPPPRSAPSARPSAVTWTNPSADAPSSTGTICWSRRARRRSRRPASASSACTGTARASSTAVCTTCTATGAPSVAPGSPVTVTSTSRTAFEPPAPSSSRRTTLLMSVTRPFSSRSSGSSTCTALPRRTSDRLRGSSSIRTTRVRAVVS